MIGKEIDKGKYEKEMKETSCNEQLFLKLLIMEFNFIWTFLNILHTVQCTILTMILFKWNEIYFSGIAHLTWT